MEYNKRKFVKSTDRKVLHKVKKHWVTISIALLGLVGGVTAVHTNVSANADSTADQANHQLNPGQLTDHRATLQTNDQSNHSSQYGLKSQNTGQHQPSAQIVHQANLLHNGILQHAMTSGAKSGNPAPKSSEASSSASASVDHDLTQESAVTSPQTKSVNWGQTQIKFMSDGDHGNAGGDVAEVQPGAISDAFHEQNNSDTTYNNSDQSSYVINRYRDNLELPFDQNSNNWILKFAPRVTLPKNGGISKDDGTPQPGEDSSDFDYEQNAYQTNDYQYLLSSVNRTLWNYFKTMDLTNLDTDNASDLSNMFAGDQSLQKVILNDSANPHLTNLRGMFANAPQLREIDFNHFGTGQVQNMDSMFMSDVRLNHLDVSSLDTGHVTNLHGAFMSDFALSDVKGLNTWNTGQVTNLVSTFARDLALPRLNLDHWDTSRVTSMAGMFSGDAVLRDLDLSHFQTGQVSDLSSMFAGDQQLRDLNLANFDTGHVKAVMPGFPVGGMSFMFNGDNNLQQLTLGARTALNRPNQNWGAQFFNQNFDADGHDTTSALRNGQQTSGTYYSADYYQNVLTYQQYFADEQQLANQALVDANVKADPQIQSQVGQEASQINAMVNDDTARLTPASHVAKALDDVNSLASLTNLISGQSSLASSVASSVAQSSRSVAAVRSADSKIAASYRASVAQSVASRNRQLASLAASAADQKLVQSMRDSVAQSVAVANQYLALSAAHAADRQITNAYQSSVAQSVSVANQRLAASAARSADQSLAASERASVSQSVADQNQKLANLAARSANQSLVSSMRASVSNSVAVNNRQLAQSAAQSADRQLARSYQASVSNSVASANRQVANSAQQSADASLASSERDSVSASVAIANSQVIATSSVARSVSQSASLSHSVQLLVASASASAFRNNVEQIDSYDQAAGSYNRRALNDLSQINVSANASLTALKDNDLNEVADDNQLISEDNGVMNDLISGYNSAEPNNAIESAENQLSTAKGVAQDASLIIADDLTNLKSRASQASLINSNRVRSSSARHSEASSSHNQSNSAHRASSSSNSIRPSSSNGQNFDSTRNSAAKSASASRASSLSMSIESAVSDDLAMADGYVGQVNQDVSNSAVETDPQAAAVINHDLGMVESDDQAIIIDQQQPSLGTELSAGHELEQIHSAELNASQTVLSAERASANAAQSARSAANVSFPPASNSFVPQPSASHSSIVSNSNQPSSANVTSERSSESERRSMSVAINLDSLIRSLDAVPSVQDDFASNYSNRTDSSASSSASAKRSVASSRPSSSRDARSGSASKFPSSCRKTAQSANSSASRRGGHSSADRSGSSAGPNRGVAKHRGHGNPLNHDADDPDRPEPDRPDYSQKGIEPIHHSNERPNSGHRSAALPQTGEDSPAVTMAVALLTLSILGLLIRRKRRHN